MVTLMCSHRVSCESIDFIVVLVFCLFGARMEVLECTTDTVASYQHPAVWSRFLLSFTRTTRLRTLKRNLYLQVTLQSIR